MDERFTLLKETTAQLAAAQAEVLELSRTRRRLVQELHAEGLSYARIAEVAGLGRTRIHQIRHAGPGPEGAFFGAARITIATPLKREAANQRPVVAAEDFAVAQRLSELARHLGLEADAETIPLDGRIDLNRDGLVVICGPRLSKDVASVLATDPVLKFEKTPDGVWTLRDQRSGQTFRSGPDRRPPVPNDIAYLGRLPRPDGQGSLIVFTGIHPQGSLGVAQFLATELSDLHRDVGAAPFSMLLGVDYEPNTSEATQVQRLSPAYSWSQEA